VKIPRTGIGWDSHRLVAGRPLILAGVTVPSEVGLDGHSDADVLTHAVIDALLGAAGLGDIGQHFPDTDPRYLGADSLTLLTAALQMLEPKKLVPVYVDATVVLERPKIGAHRVQMAANLAAALGLAADMVNVKATTGEGIGFAGRGEGAAALAVATVIPK
jgi:2-C-methyl-D-erythritol 2,4-cyclodiphosphate synthase